MFKKTIEVIKEYILDVMTITKKSAIFLADFSQLQVKKAEKYFLTIKDNKLTKENIKPQNTDPPHNSSGDSMKFNDMEQFAKNLEDEINFEQSKDKRIQIQEIIMENEVILEDIIKEIQHNKKQHFCTIAGNEYLIKIVTFYTSLKSVSSNFTLYVCCMDDFIYDFFNQMNFENIILLHVKSMETEELLQAKSTRSISEYCWTIKSWLIAYLLNNYKVDSMIYCDSDMYFFSDPVAIYKDWGDASIYLCLQRDVEWVERKYGTYQAGLIGFKNNEIGRKAVNWWKNKCLDWCYHKEDLENDRWGDQKYLDQIPRLFADAKISGHLGINAAPWNTVYNNNYTVSRKEEFIFIEDYKLVAYHFSCIDIFDKDNYDLWNIGKTKINNNIKNSIYLPYLISLRKSIDFIEQKIGKKVSICFSKKDIKKAKTFLRYSEFDVKVSKWNEMYYFCSIASTKYILKVLTLYHSLSNKMDNFHLWICCVDNQVYSFLNHLNLINATLIPIELIETKLIKKVMQDRKMNEYCWTLKPILCQYILKNYNVEKLLYCDADLFFFSHPKKIFEEWQGHSMYMTRQRAPSKMEKLHGCYQAGLIGFSKDETSFLILKWWRDKCIRWCYDMPDMENKRWGDQKYLEQIPNLFSSIKISQNLGINAAPWNLIINQSNNYKIKRTDDRIYIDNDELIVYHFGSMLFFNEREFDLWKLEPLNIDYRIMKTIYLPYLKAVYNVIQSIKKYNMDIKNLFSAKGSEDTLKNYVYLDEEC